MQTGLLAWIFFRHYLVGIIVIAVLAWVYLVVGHDGSRPVGKSVGQMASTVYTATSGCATETSRMRWVFRVSGVVDVPGTRALVTRRIR
mgnify:FL=1